MNNMNKRYELEHYTYDGEYWIIYDHVANKYRGRYDDINTAIEDCDFFNDIWEEDNE